jgi:hypothetical protein
MDAKNMNILDLLKFTARLLSIDEPVSLEKGTTSDKYLLSLANFGVSTISDAYDWQETIVRKIVQANKDEDTGYSKAEDGYSISLFLGIPDVFGSYFSYNFYFADTKEPIKQILPEEALANEYSNYKFYIFDGFLHFYPDPDPNRKIVILFKRKGLVIQENLTPRAAVIYKEFFTLDSDKFALSDALLVKYLVYKYKEEMGLQSESNYNDFMHVLQREKDRNVPKMIVGGSRGIREPFADSSGHIHI